ncbi:calcium-binding protein [Oryzihumus leptocrescens]|uniref:Hemolysin type calcium-binding protein n=1 Tax=Oryzihumus leptocrescens TaxID=297536 RepID=A0A542ZLL2_9MICO|nr:calcium-binding protein [Oryzihumus leptocrescens]TQL61050.1 hemolysin type calcium-binding protein [Oryzihumus leptocrescens]
MARTRALACASATAAAVTVLSLVTALPAQAATYTSTGLRCTKVGTSRSETITGTSGRDVICGLGGNDVIKGLGGNDVIDGGPGNDVIDGGSGNDTEVGGAGNDVLQGGTGNDNESGGSGDDVLTGSAGNDVLNGGDGSDDLDGGSGADHVAGGTGTNWCTLDPADTTRTGCVYDAKVPWASLVRLSSTTVDLTSSARTLTYWLWVGDDTGAARVQVDAQGGSDGHVSFPMGWPTRVSGTPRGGWWRGTAQVPRWLEPATVNLNVNITDRVGRSGYHEFADALTVVDRAPDTMAPVVSGPMTITPSSVDVRSTAKTVTAKVHLVDDRSGVQYSYLCPGHPNEESYQADGCPTMELVSGTARDGTWQASYTIPKGGFGGEWNFAVWFTDAAHPSDMQFWEGPDWFSSDVLAQPQGLDPRYHQLPGDSGRFTVLGTGDVHPPTLTTITFQPSARVDSLGQDTTVGIDVAATDAEGITGVTLGLGSDVESILVPSQSLVEPTSGSAKAGIWHFDVTIPQGSPVGRYPVSLLIEDVSHRRWFLADPPTEGQTSAVRFTATQTPGSDLGAITVVPHTS